MPLLPYRDRYPQLGARVFLAETAFVSGDVRIGDDCSLWFHTVARGDVHQIAIGPGTNVQDGAVLHVTHERHRLEIGARVVIGHQAVIHGCTLEDGCLIGIGARVLDGAVVERGAQVGAGALVPPGMRVPAGHLVLGVPARVVRPLSESEREEILSIAERYLAVKEEYRLLRSRELSV